MHWTEQEYALWEKYQREGAYQAYSASMRAQEQALPKQKPEHEPEHDFLGRVMALAHNRGWLMYHTHDSRRSQPGFPDLVLARPRQPLLLVELKTDQGKLTHDQEVWQSVTQRVTGVQAHVWRPRDWDLVVAMLA